MVKKLNQDGSKVMNDRIFHEVFNPSLRDEVISSELHPYIRELNHVFGIKVLSKSSDLVEGRGINNYVMATEQGFPIARVFCDEGVYGYYTPYRAKARGSGEFDRHTYRSKKLSSLMSTLKKCKAVIKDDEVLGSGHHARCLYSLHSIVSESYKHNNKCSLDGDGVHKLLLAIKDGKDLNSFQQSDRDKYLELLDIYEKVDIMKATKEQGIKEMLKDTYLVACDHKTGHYMIADGTYNEDKVKPTTTFKRVVDLTAYPSVITRLTMLKVHLGDNFRPYSLSNNLFPVGDKFIKELDVVYAYQTNRTDFDMAWLCIAK
jgi:hypothetical protein